MLSSGMNLVTTVVGFVMSATFIVFVCTRLLCCRARPAATAGAAAPPIHLELRSHIDQREHTTHGLEPVAVAAMPTVTYNREAFGANGDAQCSICLAGYQEKETLRIMPPCGHGFHLNCIDVWLQKQSTCPICRLSLLDSSEAKDPPSSFEIRLDD